MAETNHKRNLIDLFGKHLVSLSFRLSGAGPSSTVQASRSVAYSGMLMSVRQRLLYLTAGHILADIDSAIESKTLKIESCSLVNTFGQSRLTDQPIPFDYDNTPRLYYDKDGFDFGVIALRQYYQNLLAANGVVPLEEVNWQATIPARLDLYLLLGLPQELTTVDPNRPGYLQVAPTILRLRKVDIPTSEILRQSPTERFYAEIIDPLPVSDLAGFSGGPVFGVSFAPPMTYWIIAVQSTWVAARKLIAACPVRTIGQFITEWIDENRPDGKKT